MRGACLEANTDLTQIGAVLGTLLPQIGATLRDAGLRGGTDFGAYPTMTSNELYVAGFGDADDPTTFVTEIVVPVS